MNKRINGLLDELATGFEEGTDLLLSTEWLDKNNVTLDECMSMANQIGVLLHGYLRAPKDLQMKLLLLGASHGTNLPPELLVAQLDQAEALRRLPEVMRKLDQAKDA